MLNICGCLVHVLPEKAGGVIAAIESNTQAIGASAAISFLSRIVCAASTQIAIDSS